LKWKKKLKQQRSITMDDKSYTTYDETAEISDEALKALDELPKSKIQFISTSPTTWMHDFYTKNKGA